MHIKLSHATKMSQEELAAYLHHKRSAHVHKSRKDKERKPKYPKRTRDYV